MASGNHVGHLRGCPQYRQGGVMHSAENDVPEVGTCLWANQICEQPNYHGCKTCEAIEPVRPRDLPPTKCPACEKPVYFATKWSEWACSDLHCVNAHGPGPGGGHVIPPGRGNDGPTE